MFYLKFSGNTCIDNWDLIHIYNTWKLQVIHTHTYIYIYIYITWLYRLTVKDINITALSGLSSSLLDFKIIHIPAKFCSMNLKMTVESWSESSTIILSSIELDQDQFNW